MNTWELTDSATVYYHYNEATQKVAKTGYPAIPATAGQLACLNLGRDAKIGGRAFRPHAVRQHQTGDQCRLDHVLRHEVVSKFAERARLKEECSAYLASLKKGNLPKGTIINVRMEMSYVSISLLIPLEVVEKFGTPAAYLEAIESSL